MKTSNLLFILLFILSTSLVWGQKTEQYQSFDLKPMELVSDISRSSDQEISFGNIHIQAKFVANDLMSAEVQRETPDIYTYDLFDEQGNVFGNAVISPLGVWLNYWYNNKLTVVMPDRSTDNPYDHFIDNGQVKASFECDYAGVMKGVEPTRLDLSKLSSYRGTMRNGDMKRTYRMVVASTEEFYELNGGTQTAANSIIVSSIAGIRAIYMREMAISFTIVGKKIYTSADDPFDPANGSRPDQAGKIVAQNWNKSKYDIGHVLHKTASGGDGWGSGGIARLSAVCNDFEDSGSPGKAKGWSGSYNNEGFSWYSLFGHEVGHMFGAQHTFNGNGESCEDNISETNAYEIGSGTTIMSYNGICGEGQNIPNNGELDNYFHIASLLQITNHCETIGSCATQVPTNNTIPDITANACGEMVRIPKNTPFYLRGEGMDEDHDEVYYSWEQFDEDGPGTGTQGRIGNAAGGHPKAPLFKCIPPSHEQFERYFPDLKSLAKGVSSDPFQALSRKPRTLHFKLVGRDFRTTGGAYGFDDLEVEVVNVGPLKLTSTNSGNTVAAGEMMEVTWDPMGSEDLCQNATIKLSTNSGLSYDIVLATDVNYDDGSSNVIIPSFLTNTNKARIMIACSDSDCSTFFDISDNDFNITSDCNIDRSYVCPTVDGVYEQMDPALDFDLNYTTGKLQDNIISVPVKEGSVVVNNLNGSSCKKLTIWDVGVKNISVSEGGTYIFSVDVDFSNGFGFITVFNADSYSSSNPCASFVGSSGRWAGTSNAVSASYSVSLELEACQEYIIEFYNYSANKTKIESINGPGNVLLIDPDMALSYGYIAVNDATNLISAYSPTADFTTLAGGFYTIYGVQYETADTDMNDYIGQLFHDFSIDGDCYRTSENSFKIEIESTCLLESVSPGSTTDCKPIDNTYIQKIIVKYISAPATGQINVNGQLFNITSSPQVVEYVSQSNGVVETLDIFFTEEPSCIQQVSFQQQENCCSFELDIPSTLTTCAGDEVTIDAGTGGNGGGSYKWYKDNTSISNTSKELIVSESGIYSVEVSNATGCTRKANVEVVVSPIPTLTVSDNTTICENDNFVIMATTDGVILQWFKGDVKLAGETNANLTVSASGTYIIVSENLVNCSVKDTVIITQTNAPIVDLGPDKTSCIGNEEVYTAPTGVNYMYEWYIDGVKQASTAETFTVTNPGTIGLAVLDDNLCRGYDESEIAFAPGPTLTIDKPMVELCQGDESTITATTDASSIYWLKDGNPLSGATSKSITISEPGQYTAHVEGSGCEVEKIATVFVHDNPTIDIPSEAVGCQGEQLTISVAQNATVYKWTNASNEVISNINEAIVTQAGIYTIEVKNEFECTASQDIEVKFTTRPTITLDETVDICEGTTQQITATTDGSTYQWQFNGNDISAANTIHIDVSESGTYTIFSYNGSDCFESASTEVEIRPAPMVDIGSGYTLCPGESIDLDAGNPNDSYVWSTGQTSQAINIAHPGSVTEQTDLEVTVNVSNQYNCSTTGVTNIVLYPNINAQIDGDMGICPGGTISLTATGGQSFEWTGDNIISGSTASTMLASPITTTTYQVEVTDSQCSGQTETASFEVKIYEPGEVSAGDDKTLVLGKSIQLDGSGGTVYNWTPDLHILSGQGTATPIVSPLVDTKYYVTITDFNGCEQSDSVFVKIVDDPLSVLKHITIITPNDDNMNDELEFIGLESFPSNTLVIYNRWGSIVYEAKDYQKHGVLFNGTRNGEELPADTYYYVLKFDEYVIQERLTIVRPK